MLGVSVLGRDLRPRTLGIMIVASGKAIDDGRRAMAAPPLLAEPLGIAISRPWVMVVLAGISGASLRFSGPRL